MIMQKCRKLSHARRQLLYRKRRYAAHKLANHLVFLLIFGHVDANEAFLRLLLMQIGGDLLGQLGLTNAARAEKEKD